MSRTLDTTTGASPGGVTDSALLQLVRELNQFRLQEDAAARLILNTALGTSGADAGQLLLFDRHTQGIKPLFSTAGYAPAAGLHDQVRDWLRATSDAEDNNSVELLCGPGEGSAAALFARERVQGAIVLSGGEEFARGDKEVLKIFAEVAADTLARINIETEQDMLLHVFEDIGSRQELNEIYERIEETVRHLFKCDGVSILEKSTERPEAGPVLRNIYDTSREYLGLEIPHNEGLVWWAIRKKRPLLFKGEIEGKYHVIHSTGSIKDRVVPFMDDIPYRYILTCPIEYKGEDFGAIYIYNRTSGNRFDIKLDPLLLSKIGVQVAIAVKNGEELQRAKAAHSKPLRRIREVINSTEPRERVVRICLKQAVKFLGGDSGFITMRTLLSNEFVPQYVWGRDQDSDPIPTFDLDSSLPRKLGIVGRVAREGRYYLTTDAENDRFFIGQHTGSKIAVPLRPPNEELMGVLSVDSHERGAFTEQQAATLQGIAEDIALYIYKTRFLEALTLLVKPLFKIEDEKSLYDETLQKLEQMLEVKVASILRIDRDDPDNMETRAATSDFTPGFTPGRIIPRDRALASWRAVDDRMTVAVADLKEEPSNIYHRNYIEEHGLRSMLSVPILLKDTPLGVINVYSSWPHKYSELDKRLLELLADTLAVNINNVELVQKDKKQREELEDTLEKLRKSYHEQERLQDGLRKADKAVENNNRMMSIHEMVTSFVHDARNSLHSMSPHISELRDIAEALIKKERVWGHTREELEESIRIIGAEHKNLADYFEKLNNYARVLETRKKKNSIKQAIELVLELMMPRIRRTNKTKMIDVRTNNLRDFEFVFDRGQIEQVISNLVLNALQAMEKKGTQLYIGTELVRKKIRGVERQCVKIRIHDDGPGIKPEHRSQIFDVFFTTKIGTGTGFGLTLCKKIVEGNHEGLLDFESELNRGTTFDVYLPHQTRET